MRVRLNLATKPLESQRRFLAAAGLSAALAGIIFFLLGAHVYSARKAATVFRVRSQKMRAEFVKAEAQRKELEGFFNRKDVASLHDRAAFINGVIVLRSFGWTKMFMDLEHILPPGVRVISIAPKQVSGHVEVTLSAGAASEEAMLNLVHALETSKEFSDVQLQGWSQSTGTNAVSIDQRVVRLTAFYTGI